MENFREIAEAGERHGLLDRAGGAEELAAVLTRALADVAATAVRGERAKRFVAANRGAAAACADLVLPLLAGASPGRAAVR